MVAITDTIKNPANTNFTTNSSPTKTNLKILSCYPGQLTRERKQIEVKDHKLPNMKKFFIEFLKDRIRYVGGAVVTVDDGSAHTVDGDPIPCKLQRLENTNRGIKLDACEKELKGYYSDSETHRSRKKYKYHACKECQCLILPSCCRQNKPIKKRVKGKNLKSLQVSDSETARIKSIPTKYSRCLDCSGLASTSCCVETNYWCDPVHARPKKRARSGKKQKRRRKRPRYASSSSSVTENETLRHGLVSSNAATEGNKVDYTLDTHSEFQPNVTSETGMIPCIRAMVTSSQSIDIGTLFVITCNGAVIGSEETCDIQIDEDDVSGQHATVTYNPEQRNYFITDLGSDAGTTLNSTTENSPGVSAVIPIPVTHKSILLIGRCIFVLHLHPGYDTCDDCEPGQIKALLQQEQSQSRQISTGRDIQAARVSELQNLKKKYRLHRAEKTSIGPRYKDRAQERRKTVGSDNPYEKNEMPTSYDIELADHNKGRQMLEKMGWNKGKSLGKSQSGITEPIKPRGAGKSKFGLGKIVQ